MEGIITILLVLSLCYGSVLAKPPNIIFIVADDLGWNDVGWHNPEMKTPNMDKLAKDGVILDHSYVNYFCSPSRTSFMTGYFPYHVGLQHYVIMPRQGVGVPLNFPFLPQKLKELGYQNHMIGKWHLGFCNWKYTPTYRGFDSFYGYYNAQEGYYNHSWAPGDINGYDLRNNTRVAWEDNKKYSTYLFTERAEHIIAKHDQKDPLFMYMPFQNNHDPMEVPDKYLNMYPGVKTKLRRIYSAMTSALDDAIGNVTSALTKAGMMDNTVIVFTTDNGGPTYDDSSNWPLRGGKTTYWEGGTRGVAFVWSKLLKKRGYINEGLIHGVDWFPTLLSAAGGKPDTNMDGMNQWDTISENKPSPRKEFIYNIDDVDNTAAIRVGDWKLILGYPGNWSDWYPTPPREAEDVLYFRPIDALDEEETLTWDNVTVHLYNIKDDPTEHHNLAKARPDMVKQLRARIDDYKTTMLPSLFPLSDPLADPERYGGVWSPGWCSPIGD